MEMAKSLLIGGNHISWLYIMNEIIKEVYENQFATAYETYKEAVKKTLQIDFKM